MTDQLPAVLPPIFAPYPELVAAQSTRHGGVSAAPFASLNLSTKAGDDPARVAQNRQRFCQHLGIAPERVVTAPQVHGNTVALVAQPGPQPEADGLVSNQPGLYLAVFVADCTPVLVYDPRTRAVGAAHAGWRGTVGGVVANLLAALAQHFGTRPADCVAQVGTCIGPTAFEVGQEVAAQFAPPFRRWQSGAGKFCIDLKAANRQQLLDAGVPPERVGMSPHCTVLHNRDYFSYRAEGPTSGRMLALIGVRG